MSLRDVFNAVLCLFALRKRSRADHLPVAVLAANLQNWPHYRGGIRYSQLEITKPERAWMSTRAAEELFTPWRVFKRTDIAAPLRFSEGAIIWQPPWLESQVRRKG